MIQETATKDAPWYVVPADNKWFMRVVVAAAVIETLASLDLAYPKVDEGKLKELAAAKKKLLSKSRSAAATRFTTAQVMLAIPRLFSNRRQWRACERQSNSQSPAVLLLLPAS
jgi:hypothetical protein